MPHTSAWLTRVSAELWAQPSLAFIPNRDLPEPTEPAQHPQGGARVIFAGFPSDYSLAFLLRLLGLPGIDVVGMVTSPGAHPAIAGDNALSRIAGHCDIPLLRLWRVNDDHARQDIAALDPGLVLMASFDQIVTSRTLAVPRHGWINAHPSMLPEYRGPEPIWWALVEGAARTGVTLHRAVPAFDAGPVLAQAAVPIDAHDTAGTLTRRVCATGVELLEPAVRAALADEPGTPLDLGAGSYRPSIGHRRLDTAASAVEAERMVRAGMPNMHAWALIQGRPVFVVGARLVPCGQGDIGFPDGCLDLTETQATCGCHHDRVDCPHREG